MEPLTSNCQGEHPMKNATATSHGSNRLLDVSGELTTGRGMARAYVIQGYHPPATNSQCE
jgi:hypothetical protein